MSGRVTVGDVFETEGRTKYSVLLMLRLIRMSGREPVSLAIKKLDVLPASAESGFSLKRYEACDTGVPIVVMNNTVLDGRHRVLKLKWRYQRKTVLAYVLTAYELAQCNKKKLKGKLK